MADFISGIASHADTAGAYESPTKPDFMSHALAERTVVGAVSFQVPDDPAVLRLLDLEEHVGAADYRLAVGEPAVEAARPPARHLRRLSISRR